MQGVQRVVKEPLRCAVIQIRLASACGGDAGRKEVEERDVMGARGAESGKAVS